MAKSAATEMPQEERERDLTTMFCKVTLAESWPHKNGIPLRFNPGVIHGVITRRIGTVFNKTLKPGETVEVPLTYAQAWFGLFTVPTLLEYEKDQAKAKQMRADFDREKTRAMLTWGWFPQPRKMQDGTDYLGPAKMPDVTLTVRESDGTEWDPIRIRDMYALGEYEDVSEDTLRREQARAAQTELSNTLQIAELKGMVAGLAAGKGKAS